MYPLRRALAILNAAGNVHAKTMGEIVRQVHVLLEEAQDNVKFLGTIRKPTQVRILDYAISFLPKLMSSQNRQKAFCMTILFMVVS